jgi:hypothetical protein
MLELQNTEHSPDPDRPLKGLPIRLWFDNPAYCIARPNRRVSVGVLEQHGERASSGLTNLVRPNRVHDTGTDCISRPVPTTGHNTDCISRLNPICVPNTDNTEEFPNTYNKCNCTLS